jgi:tRNA pseudouridine55 synthase
VQGERAYALARRGEAVTLEAVPVRIDEIEVEGYTWPDLSIRVRCGPGTYVRSLARDIGETLGTGGFCAALRRLASGPFRVEDALPLEALSDPAAVRAALRPAWHAVAELSIARLEAAEAMAFAQGREVPAPTVAETTDWIRVHGPAGFVGLGSVVRGGGRIRPRRVLYPEGEDAE